MFDVTVVIPAYNAAWCLARAVESVLAQTLPASEIIIVDDGSTDHTANLAAQFSHPVRTIRQPNQGLSAARNTGVQHAQSQWVAFLDADDAWRPTKLAAQAHAVHAHPHAAWTFCDAQIVDPDANPLETWTFPADITSRRQMLETLFSVNVVAGSGSAVIAKRDALIAAGLFDTRLRSVEDLDMWMRLAAFYPFAHAPGLHVDITRHNQSMSRNIAVMRHHLLAVRWKNRHLLGRGYHARRLWNRAYAGVLCDTGKTSLRSRSVAVGLRDLLESTIRNPFGWGRTSTSVMIDWLLGRWPAETINVATTTNPTN